MVRGNRFIICMEFWVDMFGSLFLCGKKEVISFFGFNIVVEWKDFIDMYGCFGIKFGLMLIYFE